MGWQYLKIISSTNLIPDFNASFFIQQFFGNIRRAAAPNPHPDPKLFAQLFRLLSMYSLVSPVKGSNVSGVENILSLLSTEDKVGAEIKERKQEYEEMIDEILLYGKLFRTPTRSRGHWVKLITLFAILTCFQLYPQEAFYPVSLMTTLSETTVMAMYLLTEPKINSWLDSLWLSRNILQKAATSVCRQ